MSDLQAYEARRQERIAAARAVIRDLFAEHKIHNGWTAEKDMVERFTQEDYQAYHAARQRLYDEGALG